jgi:hypothetical protein
MGAQRRARAIATAPRRKRDDDDKEEDNEQKKSIEILSEVFSLSLFIALLGFIKTSTVPLPFPIENQHSHSLPQIQSDTALIPTFRVDPPSQDVYGQLDCTYNHHSHCRISSLSLPSRNKSAKN